MADAPRPLSVTTPLGPDALQPVAFGGTEAISGLFRFELGAVAPNDRPVPFEALLGGRIDVQVVPPGAQSRLFSGICSRISQGARDDRRTSYRLEVVPSLWLLTRKRGHRLFQDSSAPEVLERVLVDAGTSFELRLPHPPREYVAQHRETDFEFANRLMEEEGIYYFFRHSSEGHELVLADSPEGHPELPAVQFDPKAAPSTVFSWEKVQELTPGKVVLRDHDFTLPEPIVEGEATIQESATVGTVEHLLALPAVQKLELYDYPGAYAGRFDGVDDAGRAAARRMESEAATSLLVAGESTAPALAAGSRFALAGHGDADGEYMLTSVTHSARQDDLRSGKLSYSNSFTCIPASMPFRPPRRTPRPVVGGVQTAVVVGPPGETVSTDELGRVKVRFHWDREGLSSAWIRVAQPHAGSSRLLWLPEAGDEVLVAFEDGDPSRPYVLGRLFNANDPPPEAEDREEEAE
jgi:type VI secretion system secreted protein VgrG